MKEIRIEEKDKILIVAPHPDDESIGVGGVLCSFPDKCDVLVLTDGSLGTREMTQKECRIVRKKEFKQEMEYLGIKNYYMFEKQDGMLMNDLQCLQEFDLSRYSKIFVSSTNDNHLDHTAAFFCVKNALMAQQLYNIEVYQYEVHNLLSNPTHYLDITSCIDEKETLIRKHESQMAMFSFDEMARLTAQYRAVQNREISNFYEVYSLISIEEETTDPSFELGAQLQKFKMFYKILIQWIYNYDNDVFGDFFRNNHITSCAIYGYAELGKLFRLECEKRNIRIPYVIDQKVLIDKEGGIPIYRLGEEKLETDTVIVTAVYDYHAIKRNLEKRGYKRIFSLEDVILKESIYKA